MEESKRKRIKAPTNQSHPNGLKLSRRQFLSGSAASAVVGSIPGVSQAQAIMSRQRTVSLQDYQPIYFNEKEWAFVMAACERLIPQEGEGPGALDTHVPIFIDRQLAGNFGAANTWYMDGPHQPAVKSDRGYQSPLTPAEQYRQAIAAIDVWCDDEHAKPFAELGSDVQDEVLKSLEKGELGLSDELKEFFSLLLSNTKEGYFADPMYGGNYGMQAWQHIGFPGARAAYKEWVDQHNKAYPLGPVAIDGSRG